MTLARMYAGVLGPLAFAASLLRAVLHGGGAGAVKWACVALAAFGAIGLVAGKLADAAVTQSVKARFQDALKAWESGEAGGSPSADASRR